MGEIVWFGNAETESNGRRFQDTPPYFAATMRSLRVDIQSYREDNERLVKALEEQVQLNVSMLQSLTYIQRQMNSRDQTVRPKGSKSTSRGRKRCPSGSSDSEGSTDGWSSPSHENKRKRCYQNPSRDEFKKSRPPSFNGEKRMVKKLKLGFLGWGNISMSKTTWETWRLGYPSSIWLE